VSATLSPGVSDAGTQSADFRSRGSCSPSNAGNDARMILARSRPPENADEALPPLNAAIAELLPLVPEIASPFEIHPSVLSPWPAVALNTPERLSARIDSATVLYVRVDGLLFEKARFGCSATDWANSTEPISRHARCERPIAPVIDSLRRSTVV
jgi:hypothetical protein